VKQLLAAVAWRVVPFSNHSGDSDVTLRPGSVRGRDSDQETDQPETLGVPKTPGMGLPP
jgi:hypothetical protein